MGTKGKVGRPKKIKKITQEEFNDVKPRVVAAFMVWMGDHIRDIVDCVNFIAESESVDGFLEAKKQLIQACIDFPFDMETCVPCQVILMERGEDCSKCPYGGKHGICEEDDYSSYDRILEARGELAEAVGRYAN